MLRVRVSCGKWIEMDGCGWILDGTDTGTHVYCAIRRSGRTSKKEGAIGLALAWWCHYYYYFFPSFEMVGKGERNI